MKRNSKFTATIQKIVFIAEVILAFFIIAGVFIGTIDLTKYLVLIYKTLPADAYEVFRHFLGHVLLLIIGLEFVIMLVKHSLEGVLEVLTFAVARKLIISAEEFPQMLLGIVALAGVFAIRKYLHVNEE